MIEEPAGRPGSDVLSHVSRQKHCESEDEMRSRTSEKITTSGADPRWSEGALRKADTSVWVARSNKRMVTIAMPAAILGVAVVSMPLPNSLPVIKGRQKSATTTT